ncbi:MAG: SIR2 family protein [Candidatus Aminicenantes bacterium]|nr:MAG: SIR2 family protein [Candidatus Aminicenantes bacterium]
MSEESKPIAVCTTDDMDEIVKEVSKGKCVLFLGAGVHHEPPEDSPYKYPEERRPPSGRTLSRMLAQECKFNEQFPKENITDLQRVSLCYELKMKRVKLVRRIKEAVHEGKEPSPVLKALAQLDFPLVITTNYDQLFESALVEAGKRPEICIYNKDKFTETKDIMDDPDPERPFLLKIHGDVDYGDSIVITDEDYINFVLRMSDKEDYHPVPETFRYHLKRWTILFIGYSLMDYNLRLLFKTLYWKLDGLDKDHEDYSIDPYTDPLIVKILAEQVSFLTQDVWKFVPELYRRIKNQEMES